MFLPMMMSVLLLWSPARADVFSWTGIERPPAQYRVGPLPDGFHFRIIEDSAVLDRVCRAAVGPADGIYLGCYIAPLREAVIPPGEDRETRALMEHEEGHARGWRHPERWPRPRYYSPFM